MFEKTIALYATPIREWTVEAVKASQAERLALFITAAVKMPEIAKITDEKAFQAAVAEALVIPGMEVWQNLAFVQRALVLSARFSQLLPDADHELTVVLLSGLNGTDEEKKLFLHRLRWACTYAQDIRIPQFTPTADQEYELWRDLMWVKFHTRISDGTLDIITGRDIFDEEIDRKSSKEAPQLQEVE